MRGPPRCCVDRQKRTGHCAFDPSCQLKSAGYPLGLLSEQGSSLNHVARWCMRTRTRPMAWLVVVEETDAEALLLPAPSRHELQQEHFQALEA